MGRYVLFSDIDDKYFIAYWKGWNIPLGWAFNKKYSLPTPSILIYSRREQILHCHVQLQYISFGTYTRNQKRQYAHIHFLVLSFVFLYLQQ